MNAVLLWQILSYNATFLCFTLLNLNTQNQVLKGVIEKSLSASPPRLLIKCQSTSESDLGDGPVCSLSSLSAGQSFLWASSFPTRVKPSLPLNPTSKVIKMMLLFTKSSNYKFIGFLGSNSDLKQLLVAFLRR